LAREKIRERFAIVRSKVKRTNIKALADFLCHLKLPESIPGERALGTAAAQVAHDAELGLEELKIEHGLLAPAAHTPDIFDRNQAQLRQDPEDNQASQGTPDHGLPSPAPDRRLKLIREFCAESIARASILRKPDEAIEDQDHMLIQLHLVTRSDSEFVRLGRSEVGRDPSGGTAADFQDDLPIGAAEKLLESQSAARR
jgi:hypothetical protein